MVVEDGRRTVMDHRGKRCSGGDDEERELKRGDGGSR